MPKGARRSVAPAPPVAKKPRGDPNLVGVREAIERADLPDNCRQMFLACFAKALGTPAVGAAQSAVVDMIGKVIGGVEGGLRAAFDAQVTAVQAAEGAMAAAAAASEASKAATVTLAETTKAMGDVRARAEEARAAQRKLDADLVKLTEKKAEKTAAVEALSADAGDGTAAQYEALLPHMEDAGMDESLRCALPAACKKVVSERTSFDIMVLESAGQCLKDKVASLASLIAEATQAAEQGAAAAKEAEGQHSAATEAQRAQAARLVEVQAAQKEAEAAAATAAKEATAATPQLEAAIKARDERAAELENFVAYNVGCFELLRDAKPETAVAAAAGAWGRGTRRPGFASPAFVEHAEGRVSSGEGSGASPVALPWSTLLAPRPRWHFFALGPARLVRGAASGFAIGARRPWELPRGAFRAEGGRCLPHLEMAVGNGRRTLNCGRPLLGTSAVRLVHPGRERAARGHAAEETIQKK
eukprot:CAMPEP_0198607064 /NCGR_PEP_ID=MMETSP1462-20131121/155206_1 /TAXON_ID=1333877 /ORGANISM="Brandtodinium nutriculum, Strain RCC3387" /LENGTH=473 /DNA_ID=CAMNT_0044338871 /DNA_START=93 /DNA_END=1513 /DNA_ORIENTATION=+